MIFYKQSDRRNCGQIAVACLAECPVAAVEAIIGHDHSTYTRDLIKAIRTLSLRCPDRRQSRKTFPTSSDAGIMLILPNGKKSGGHWVAVGGGFAWDGTTSEPMALEVYEKLVELRRFHIAGWLPVEDQKA